MIPIESIFSLFEVLGYLSILLYIALAQMFEKNEHHSKKKKKKEQKPNKKMQLCRIVLRVIIIVYGMILRFYEFVEFILNMMEFDDLRSLLDDVYNVGD